MQTNNCSEDKIGDMYEWLQKFSPATNENDSNNGSESPSHLSNNSIKLNMAGFVQRSVRWEANTSNSEGKFNFLNDWEELWNFLTGDDVDEIATQLPFFRAAVTLIFHIRIRQLMYIMFVWNIVLLAIIQSQFSRHQKGFVGGNFLSIVFEWAVYFLICLMLKGPQYIRPYYVFFGGTSPNPSHTDKENTLEEIEAREIAQEAIDQRFSLYVTLKRLIRRGKDEMAFVVGRKQPEAHFISSPWCRQQSNQSLSYYSWINMALKVLIRDYRIDIAQINFNRPSYRFMTLFAICLFPIYATIVDYVSIITALQSACNHTNVIAASHSCSFYSYQFIFSVFGLTFVLNHIFYGAAIIIALVGLAYGGEIAFRLAECWVAKYHSLRRFKINTDRHTNHTADNSREQRTRTPSSVAKAAFYASWTLPGDVHSLQRIIHRDSIEHYLFITALLKKAGDMWSPVLLLFVFLMAFVCVSDVFVLYEYFQLPPALGTTVVIVRMICFVLVRGLVFLVYPLLSIAFANSYFLKMYDVFRIADETDYEWIGGRNRWLTIFKESPATWTFFGLAITPERLAALLWTGLVALAGIFLSSLIDNS